MKNLILLFLILSGCAARSPVPDFTPTNSMCIDATVANMHAAGCKVVSIEKVIYGNAKITCYESDSSDGSAWLNNDFFAIAFGSSIPEDVEPICTDPFVILTTAEKD